MKIHERKRQTETKTYLFGEEGESHNSVFEVSNSNDSGIDDIDPFSSSRAQSKGRNRISQSLSQIDLTDGFPKINLGRTCSTASSDLSNSSQCQLFVTSDTDSQYNGEGYQVLQDHVAHSV